VISVEFKHGEALPQTLAQEISHPRQICVIAFLHKYEACPESKDTKVLNMYNIFNLQKRHCE